MSEFKFSQIEIARILEAIPDTYYRTDNDGKIRFISPSVEHIYGFKPTEVLGKKMSDYYKRPEERDIFLKTMQENNGRVAGFEAQMQHKNGHHIWVSTSAWFIRDKKGNIVGVEGLSRDITHSKNLEEILRETSENYRGLYEEHKNILEASPGGILKLNRDLIVTYVNPAMEQILGVPRGESSQSIGANILEIPTVIQAGFVPILKKVAAMEEVATEGYYESLYKKKTYISVKGVPFIKKGQFEGAVFLITDITRIKEMSDSLKYQASHDALTGLMNRREFEKQLLNSMELSRQENIEHTLCYVDLDQFKIVNDTCGHMAGDELLRQLSPLLEETIGKNNLLARLGGDEFGVIFLRTELSEGVKRAESLLQTIREFRFQKEDKIFEIGGSIGLVAITANSESISELLSAADSACYVAKESGRNRVQIFTVDDNALLLQKHHMQWFQKLNQAIEHNDFIIYFQPINAVNLNLSYTVVGEFLVRMQGENNTIINPSVFIPSAERYQLMNKIDRFVVDSVFSLLALKPGNNLNRISGKGPRKVYTINLSSQSISDPNFSDFVEDTFEKYGISPDSICFEITETAVISNLAEALKFIERLKNLGCLFALDDFGSGMSSLAHLKKLPVDIVKIDGSFILSMKKEPADVIMIKSVVDISRVMNLHTIAEFVEDEDTAETLKTMGIDYTQGYFHGRPSDAKENVNID